MNLTLGEHETVASICKESFYDFLQEFWETIIEEPPYFNWHVKFLCDELQKIAFDVRDRKPREYDWICNIPPGSTKSTICSQMFPAWVWTFMPYAQFICVSYSYSVAMKDSLKTRDIVESDKYQKCFPGIKLREDQNTKGLFVNSHKGFRLAAGVGGAITGQHGHFLLVDDPLNPEQSYSEAELKTVNRWMRTTLPSRRIPKHVAPILLIQQRLAQGDPTGEMLERYAESNLKLRHVCLPGELTEGVRPAELKAQYFDGFLDPERLSEAVLEQMRSELGEYGYAAQVLQDPVPAGGGMFDTEKLLKVDVCPKIIKAVRSWDKAGTEGGGKYSAGAKIGQDEAGRYGILDVRREQVSAYNRERLILKTAEEDGKDVPILIEIEGGSGGKESGENTLRNLAGYHVIMYHPTGDKPARAYPFASQMGGGNVFTLSRGWTRMLIEELRYFPFGKYSDQVDCCSAGFNHLAKGARKIGGMWRLHGK